MTHSYTQYLFRISDNPKH